MRKDKTRTDRYGVGLRWQVEWIEPGGGKKRKSFANKDAAKAHLIAVSHEVQAGTYIPEARGKVEVADVLPLWLTSKARWKASTKAATASNVSATIEPHWGEWRLIDIRRADVQSWVNGMDKAARTVDTIYGHFRAFLGWCVAEGRIASNPAVGVSLPRGKKREHVFLTVPQLTALADATEPHYQSLIWFLATTGLRMGEACELRVRDVDLARRRLTVSRGVVFVGGVAVVDTPKSHKKRTVPLTGQVVEELAGRLRGAKRDDLVFSTTRGLQIRANNFKRRAFDKAVAAANDAGANIPADMWVHDLRHTAASLAVASGASVKSVQRMLGHATAAMTLDLYAGLFDQDLDDVAVRMDELILRAAPPVRPPAVLASA